MRMTFLMTRGCFSPPLVHSLSCVGINQIKHNVYFLTWQVGKMGPEKADFITKEYKCPKFSQQSSSVTEMPIMPVHVI